METKTHVNSEAEKIAIEQRMLRGEPCQCLVIYDDAPPRGTGRPAPMLLDNGTRAWLMENLFPATPPQPPVPEAGGQEIDEIVDALLNSKSKLWPLTHECKAKLVNRLASLARLPSPLPPAEQQHECYACFRTRPDENDGKEFFMSALWHNDTKPEPGERWVKGYFIEAAPADHDIGDASMKTDQKLIAQAFAVAGAQIHNVINAVNEYRNLADIAGGRVPWLKNAEDPDKAREDGRIAAEWQERRLRVFVATGAWPPAASPPRSETPAEQRTHANVVRSISRET